MFAIALICFTSSDLFYIKYYHTCSASEMKYTLTSPNVALVERIPSDLDGKSFEVSGLRRGNKLPVGGNHDTLTRRDINSRQDDVLPTNKAAALDPVGPLPVSY